MINTATNEVTATIPVSGQPIVGLAVNPNGQDVYAANNVYTSTIDNTTIDGNVGNVTVINTATNTVTATILQSPTPGGYYGQQGGVAVSPDGSVLYAGNFVNPGSVLVIDTATDTVIDNVSVGDEPTAVVVSADGDNIYVLNYLDETVSVISLVPTG